MVKKILEDGTECKKCQQITEFLKEKGLLERIDRIIYANPKEPEGEGIKLAKTMNVRSAPFFVVEREGKVILYTSVMELIRKEL